jgi:hypothetical protein
MNKLKLTILAKYYVMKAFYLVIHLNIHIFANILIQFYANTQDLIYINILNKQHFRGNFSFKNAYQINNNLITLIMKKDKNLLHVSNK